MSKTLTSTTLSATALAFALGAALTLSTGIGRRPGCRKGEMLRRRPQGQERLQGRAGHHLRRHLQGRSPGQRLELGAEGELRKDRFADLADRLRPIGRVQAEDFLMLGRAGGASAMRSARYDDANPRRTFDARRLRPSRRPSLARPGGPRPQAPAFHRDPGDGSGSRLLRDSRRELSGRRRSLSSHSGPDSRPLSAVDPRRRLVHRRGRTAGHRPPRPAGRAPRPLPTAILLRTPGLVDPRRRVFQRPVAAALRPRHA